MAEETPKIFYPKGYEFSFLRQCSCAGTNSRIVVQIANLDRGEAETQVQNQVPQCSTCYKPFKYSANIGRYGTWK